MVFSIALRAQLARGIAGKVRHGTTKSRRLRTCVRVYVCVCIPPHLSDRVSENDFRSGSIEIRLCLRRYPRYPAHPDPATVSFSRGTFILFFSRTGLSAKSLEKYLRTYTSLGGSPALNVPWLKNSVRLYRVFTEEASSNSHFDPRNTFPCDCSCDFLLRKRK